MKLLVYDKFWDSFLRLNKTTQKDVIKFKKKFRDNPKSSGIHLEPISTFKDKSLRTARISNQYRAIIKVPDSGTTYYLLWVDNHDEAMDWAKNKMFPWDENTQSIQVYTIPEKLIKEEKPEPKKEVPVSFISKFGDSKLEAIGVPSVLLPSVKTLKTLEELETMENYLPQLAFENLFYLFDGANIDQLIQEVKDGKVDSTDLDEKAGSINNQRNFIELTDDELFNEVLQGNLEKWKYYLHPSQRVLVNRDFNGPMKITGGAGTGKTVAALHRLKYLIENSEKGAKPVLFTTFTRALTDNLKSLVGGLKISSSNIRIQNIDGLAFDLAREYKLIGEKVKVFGLSAVKNPTDIWDEILEEELAEFDKEFLESEYSEVVLYHDIKSKNEYLKVPRLGRGTAISRRKRAEIWSLFEIYDQKKKDINCIHKEEIYNLLSKYLNEEKTYPFSYVIVDELQDFSNVELRLIRSLTQERENDLFFVGDPLQRIYNKRINFSQVGINVRGKRSRRLRINYRTSEEIKKLAVSVIEDCQFDNFDGETEEKSGYISLYHGEAPAYSSFKTKADELTYISEQLETLIDNGVNYSEIAISSRTKAGLKDIRDFLHKNSIPYADKDAGKLSGQQNGIRLLTFHSIKGLEFKHVILTDVNDRTCPKTFFGFDDKDEKFKETYLKSERSLIYVAISRAKETILLTGVGTKSDLVKI